MNTSIQTFALKDGAEYLQYKLPQNTRYSEQTMGVSIQDTLNLVKSFIYTCMDTIYIFLKQNDSTVVVLSNTLRK